MCAIILHAEGGSPIDGQGYAGAMVELGRSAGSLDEINRDMEMLGGLLEKNTELDGYLSDPVVKDTEKKQVICRVVRASVLVCFAIQGEEAALNRCSSAHAPPNSRAVLGLNKTMTVSPSWPYI